MKTVKVIFSVGVAHPLYNKEVEAEILKANCGYNGKCTYARAIEPVHFEEDPEGLLIFDKNKNFKGFGKTEAHDVIHEGYVDRVIC